MDDDVMSRGTGMLLGLLVFPLCAGQTFETTVDGTFYNTGFPGHNIVTGPSGSFVIAGKTKPSEGLNSLVLSKFSGDGTLLWVNNYESGEYVDHQISLFGTGDQGFLLTASGKYDIRLIRTDSTGNRDWTKTLQISGYEGGPPVLLSADSMHFAIFGTKVLGPGDNYRRVISFEITDTGGISSVVKQIEETRHLIFQSVSKVNGPDGFIVTGITGTPYPEGSSFYVCKTDQEGNKVWSKILDDLRGVKNSTVSQLGNGQFVFAGTYIDADFRDRIFFLWLDSDGNRILLRELGENMERACGLVRTPDQGYAFVGSTGSRGNGQDDVLLIKTDIVGREEWTRTFGGALPDAGYEICLGPDSGLLIAGSTASYGGGQTLLIRTTSGGEVACRLDQASFYNPVIHSVGADIPRGDIIVTYQPDFGDSRVLLYKESAFPGSFILVNRKPVSQEGIIHDTTAVPSLRSYHYKVRIVNECGDTSLASSVHGSIFLEVFSGGNNTRNLYWNHYLGADVASYVILRGKDEGQMMELDYVPGQVSIYSDLNPPDGNVYYRIRAILDEQDQEDVPYSSLSNIAAVMETAGSTAHRSGSLRLTPNPVRTVSRISFPNPGHDAYTLSLYDLSGRLVSRTGAIREDHCYLDREGIGRGMFLLELKGKDTYRLPIIIE